MEAKILCWRSARDLGIGAAGVGFLEAKYSVPIWAAEIDAAKPARYALSCPICGQSFRFCVFPPGKTYPGFAKESRDILRFRAIVSVVLGAVFLIAFIISMQSRSTISEVAKWTMWVAIILLAGAAFTWLGESRQRNQRRDKLSIGLLEGLVHNRHPHWVQGFSSERQFLVHASMMENDRSS